MIRASDFYTDKQSAIPFLLTDEGRKKVISAFEDTMQQVTPHENSGQSLSYRRCIEAQVQILTKVILSERPVYVPFRRGG